MLALMELALRRNIYIVVYKIQLKPLTQLPKHVPLL